MTTPPAKKTTQAEFIKTALRLPPDLHREILEDAERHGHSMNMEILNRIRAGREGYLAAELAEIKATLRKLLDAIT